MDEEKTQEVDKVIKIRFSSTDEMSVKQALQQIINVHTEKEEELKEAR